MDYALEYGCDRLEMHVDACPPPSRVLLVDDVLPTGGTARTACGLIEKIGGTVVGVGFLLRLSALGGLSGLAGRTVHSVLEINGL